MHALLDLLFFIAAGQPLPSSLTASAPHHYHPRRCPFLASSSAPVAGRRLRLFLSAIATIFLFLLCPTAPCRIFLLNLYRCPAAPASSSVVVVAAPSVACSPCATSIASTTALAAATHSFLSYSASSVAIAASPHRCHLSPVATASSSQPLLPQPSPSSPLPSSSIVVGPLTLKHQQRHCYLVAPHLLDAPHDAVASSLVVATLVAATACNRALTAAPPCCHRNLSWDCLRHAVPKRNASTKVNLDLNLVQSTKDLHNEENVGKKNVRIIYHYRCYKVSKRLTFRIARPQLKISPWH
ncbi:hypothetical protein GW17_00048205 [Ensete ventricosum]|nr:hypothetical protein GW17_00048205 [Ensete ventricosum]